MFILNLDFYKKYLKLFFEFKILILEIYTSNMKIKIQNIN